MDTARMLRTTVDIRHENGLWADLRIVNDGEQTVMIHKPGRYEPTEGWGFSREAYDAAVLLSFHFLRLALSREDGIPVDSTGIATRANHDVEPPVALKPSDSLTISIPLHEIFVLESGVRYSLELSYGDDDVRVHGSADFTLSQDR